jgi:hypothetical protein
MRNGQRLRKGWPRQSVASLYRRLRSPRY